MKTRISSLAVGSVVALLYAGIVIGLSPRTNSGTRERPSSKQIFSDFAASEVYKLSNTEANRIADSGCDDIWTATGATSVPSARARHTAVWTGNEMIMWGGQDSGFTNTGGTYNPITDTWTAISTTNAPEARNFHTAIWTGSEMIVWGGSNSLDNPLNTGGRYNPSTDTWTPVSPLNAPTSRLAHTAVWTGSEMIVWGGVNNTGPLNTGSRYNPITDTWTTISTTNAPATRYVHTAVWTGSEMIVWGGTFFDGIAQHWLNTGGRYNPNTDAWTAVSNTNEPGARSEHTAVWTGSEMIVWGGGNGINHVNTGGRYNPSTDTWMAVSTTNAPSGRQDQTAVWTGSTMIVWGGLDINGSLNTGGRYCAESQASPTPVLGNYLDTSVLLSGGATVAPSAAPTNTTSINVSTSTNFKGKLEAVPNTGNVRVTDAHPAGTYTVTVKAFNSGGGSATTKTFTLTVTTPPTCNPVSFAPTTLAVGDRVGGVLVGDFNGDGKQDLAAGAVTASWSQRTLILLGDGVGHFNFFSEVPIGARAVADFNDDGKQDLVALDSNNAVIYLGDGVGHFSAANSVNTECAAPFQLAVGDFNGDGKLDLATACYFTNSVTILLGVGGGNFGPPTSFSVSDGPQGFAVGDFNGDGKPDLAVACQPAGVVSILLGNGAGSFAAAINRNAGATPRDIEVGDFNGDGKQDLAISNPSVNAASIILGDGAGGFGPPTSFAVGSNPTTVIAIGDFNGDGKQDLAVPNFDSANVSILFGDGAGLLGPAINFSVGLSPFGVAVGDFNGDGMQDLATPNWDSNNVSILLRDCAPTEIQINKLITSINASVLSAGTKTSLNGKLQTAVAALQVGDISTACTKLQDFLNYVKAQRGKMIAVKVADQLMTRVIEIRVELGCS